MAQDADKTGLRGRTQFARMNALRRRYLTLAFANCDQEERVARKDAEKVAMTSDADFCCTQVPVPGIGAGCTCRAWLEGLLKASWIKHENERTSEQ